MSTLFRALLLVLLTTLPALAQTVTGTVTAATQLRVSAGNPPANTNTRPAGTNLTGGLNLGTSWTFTPLFVSVNSAFGYSATATSITHTINESMSGFNAPVSAGPHATLLTLAAPQPVVGTLIVQYTPGASGSGTSSTASIDIGNDGSVEWTRAPGTAAQTFQQEVTVSGSLQIRVSTAMVSTAHSLSVQFTNWTAVAQLPLANSSFENGLTGWDVSGAAAAFGAAFVRPRTGSSQCLMAGNATVAQTFLANSGETHALHCYAASNGRFLAGDTAGARFEYLDAAGAAIGGASAALLSFNTAGNFYLDSATLTATAPTATVRVRVTLYFAQAVPSGVCAFDDVTFQRVSGCGAFALPVGALSGAGGKFGSYFTLDSHAHDGVSLCGIDLVSTAPAGAAVDATVYQHRTRTDATQLTLADTGPENWCPIASLHGVSNGFVQPTPFAIVNATNSLQMRSGPHLFAIMFDTSSQGIARFVPAASVTAPDPGNNLQFLAGASLNFGFDPNQAPLVAGYFPATLHYEIASGPVTPTPCAAEATAVGIPCGGEPNSVFEMLPHAAWDLTSSDLLVTGNGTGASLSTAPATPLDPVQSPAIPISGTLGGPFPLGFSLDAFGIPNVSFVMVSMSGQIFFGGQSNRIDYPTPGTWSNDPVRRLAACCTQFAAGNIYVDRVPGIQTVVTFESMWEANFNQYSTFQVVITPTTMRVRYDPASWFEGVVGFHGGIALPVPPAASRVDLTAGPTPFTSPNAGPDITLTALSRPLLGANFDFRLDNAVPFGLVFLDFLQAAGGVPLPTPLFAGACTYYLGPNPPLSFAVANGTVASSFTPNNTVFLGVPFALQGGGILPNGQLAASNAINGTVGNW